MRHARRCGVTVLPVVALSAIVSATASAALPEFLGGTNIAFTTAGGAGVLELLGGAKVNCTSSQGSGVDINSKEGTFDELFLGCTTKVAGLTQKCTGLTDTVTGSILAKGTFVLGFELGSLKPIVALTIQEIHFECSIALALVKGCVVAKISPEKTATTEFTLTLKQTTGEQELRDYTTDAGAAKACALLGSLSTTSTHTCEGAGEGVTAKLRGASALTIDT